MLDCSPILPDYIPWPTNTQLETAHESCANHFSTNELNKWPTRLCGCHLFTVSRWRLFAKNDNICNVLQ